MAVAITRRDLSVGELRRETAGTRDAKAARRMLAIAFVLEGQSRQDAAAICGMDRQTLRDWVHHYNADGLAGLVNRVRRNGSRPHLSPEQEAVVVEWVKQGPDLARVGRPPCTSARWAGQAKHLLCLACANSHSGACRCVRSTRTATRRRRRVSEGVPSSPRRTLSTPRPMFMAELCTRTSSSQAAISFCLRGGGDGRNMIP